MLPNVLKSCSEPGLCTVTLWRAQACRGNVWFPWWREHIPTISSTGVRQRERHSVSLVCSYIKHKNNQFSVFCGSVLGSQEQGLGEQPGWAVPSCWDRSPQLPSSLPGMSGNDFWGCRWVEITEGLISQYSSKLNNNEFLVGLGICCDTCSLFVLTETLQALLCPARCRQTAD